MGYAVSGFGGVSIAPGGGAIAGVGDNEAKPFEAFAVFSDGGECALGGAAFALGGDVLGDLVAE